MILHLTEVLPVQVDEDNHTILWINKINRLNDFKCSNDCPFLANFILMESDANTVRNWSGDRFCIWRSDEQPSNKSCLISTKQQIPLLPLPSWSRAAAACLHHGRFFFLILNFIYYIVLGSWLARILSLFISASSHLSLQSWGMPLLH